MQETIPQDRGPQAAELAGGHALSARLYGIELESPVPADLAMFYQRAMGFVFEQEHSSWQGQARDRRLALSVGQARRFVRAWYAIEDSRQLHGLEARLSAARIVMSRADLPGLQPGAVSFRDPDGNQFVFGIGAPASHTAFPEGIGSRAARLQHIVFASTDAERFLTFHRDVVGFGLSDRVVDDVGILRTAFLRCSNEHHSLAVFAANSNRLDHFCFEAGEWGLIRDWSDHLAESRIPLKWGPGRHGPGNNLFLFFHDHDGNWVEISAELEQVTPDRPVGTWRHEERTLNSWGIGLLRS